MVVFRMLLPAVPPSTKQVTRFGILALNSTGNGFACLTSSYTNNASIKYNLNFTQLTAVYVEKSQSWSIQ